MALQLKEWLETHVEKYKKYPTTLLSNALFFRDPPRAVATDSDYMLSPADGIIVYQKEVNGEDLVDVKGVNISIQDLMQDKDYKKPSLVVGVFMTFYDVHINRLPYGGCLYYKQLDPISTNNLPMIAVEKGIFEGHIPYKRMRYVGRNERVINTINIPGLNYKFYVVQIADVDVRVITPFTLNQGEAFSQGERFSMIRWGSQVDLVLPLDKRFDLVPVLKETMHVEAGIDPLVKIEWKWNRSIKSMRREPIREIKERPVLTL